MSPRFWPIVRHAALPLVALASILSCQNTTVIEDDPPSGPGKHYVHFLVTDTPAIPDSIWFKTPMDSGTWAFSVNPAQVGRYVNFLPVINQLGERDSMSIHAFRLGMHTGIYNVKEVNYMELGAQHLVRTSADSLAVKMLRVYDSLRKADSATYQSADTTLAGRTKLFQQVAAKLVFEGHPASSAYLRVVPVGLDTASVHRQILTLAAKSGLTLGEVVRQWNLALDYATARQALASMALDSQSVNPFRIETALALDSLHRGEPAVGLRGKISGAKGIQSVSFSVTNDSGDRTDRFVLADFPDLKSEPKDLDFAGHPTFAPRANALVGSYTLRLLVKDALGNEQSYTTPFQVGAELDHAGPSLTVLSPASAVVRDYNDSQLVVKVEAKDPSGVKSVVIDGKTVDNGLDGIWLDTLLVPVRDSSQLVKIEAKDVFGNASSAQIQIRRNEAPKPTAPRLSLVSPSNNTLVPFESKGVWVEWKAETDFGSIDSVTIDGKTAKREGGVWRLWVGLVADGKLVNLPVRAFSSVKLSATEFVSVGRSPDLAGPLVEWTDPPKDRRVAYDVKQLDVTVSVVDSSGVDSVRIGGSKVNPASGVWKATVMLAGPGELTRIRVEAWDHAKNVRDTELVVARDPIPGQLPPSYRFLKPMATTGTVIPFAESSVLVQCVLTDISGIDSGSVKILDSVASPVNDSVWERRVGLPPDGKPQVITLEAKNKRGVSVSGFVSVARAADSEKPTASRLAGTTDVSVAFDTTSVEVGWSAKDNDRIAKAWIQDSVVVSDASGYHLRVGLSVSTQWVKFRAMDPAGNEVRDSVSVERRADTVKEVTFSDTNGKLRSGSFWLKLSCATPGAIIRYTLDGSDPKATSPIFADSIKIDTTLTVKARGYAAGRVDGAATTQGYQMAVPVAVSGGGKHALVLMSDGTLWGMGDSYGNSFSERPDCSQAACVLGPIKIADSVQQMAAGEGYSLWVKQDGSLWAIGYNGSGSLGIGSFEDRAVPTKVMQGVAKVTTHFNGRQAITLVIKKDGSLWGAGACWELGSPAGCRTNNHLDYMNSFVVLAPKVIDASVAQRVAFVKSDGSAWQLTDSAPSKIADSIQSIAARNFSLSYLMLKTNGVVVGWGDNQSGELGSVGIGSSDPVVRQIDASKKWIATSEAMDLSVFLSEDRGLYAMGTNFWGLMGAADYVHHSSPELIASNVVQFDVWISRVFIVCADGTLWGRGTNANGELGLGHTNPVSQFARIRF